MTTGGAWIVCWKGWKLNVAFFSDWNSRKWIPSCKEMFVGVAHTEDDAGFWFQSWGSRKSSQRAELRLNLISACSSQLTSYCLAMRPVLYIAPKLFFRIPRTCCGHPVCFSAQTCLVIMQGAWLGCRTPMSHENKVAGVCMNNILIICFVAEQIQ